PRQRKWESENPLDRLDRFGLLGPKTSLAHCVWCNDQELNTLAEKGAQSVTCPGSNRILGAGKANIEAWSESGVQFGFGLDSSAEEILPIEIAELAMDRDSALEALTSGGRSCTDLETHLDTVTWADEELTRCLEVWIDGKEMVSEGALKDAEKYQAAKERISHTLFEDRANREGRIAELDRAMPNYQRELDSCLG
ncbi:MAG: amidohydrolase family protein, partial [Aquiluna sp.]